ncbi:hypothetical protein F5Y14DRAFT_456403 [Nemania sp. NC0429]|nr:hypothetical protein F5Y14DRAFT_456403 [Nemania sp. NC0429]
MDDSATALALHRIVALNATKTTIEDVELALNALHLLPRSTHAAWRLRGAATQSRAQVRLPVPDEERAWVARGASMVQAHLGLQSRFASARDVERSSHALTGLGFAAALCGALSEICAAFATCAGRLETNAVKIATRAARGFRRRRRGVRGVGYVGAARGRTSSLRVVDVVGARARGLAEILDSGADSDADETGSWDEYAASCLTDDDSEEGW